MHTFINEKQRMVLYVKIAQKYHWTESLLVDNKLMKINTISHHGWVFTMCCCLIFVSKEHSASRTVPTCK